MVQGTSSVEYLFSIIREYQSSGLAYAGQVGVDGIGHSDNWDNGGYSRRMFFKRTPYWKATYLWYQLDTSIDTIYMALIKIGNKWYQLNLSAQGSKADEIYWKEGFRSKFFEV